jgi:hypothetical protein
MSRIGIPADIAERVLDHALQGVRRVYDLHAYVDEKRTALERLAEVVMRIVDPESVVVPFSAARSR